jgi:Glycosyl hydrolases family 16
MPKRRMVVAVVPPRWRLTESYSGAQIAQQWRQVAQGAPFCKAPGTFSVQGRTLDLSVGGVYGDCTRFTSTFTTGFGKTAARMYIPRDVVADPAAWPAFWGYPESRAWPTAGEIDVYEQKHGGGLACTYH